MSLKTTIARIQADIEALPADARAEILKDQAWIAKHPVAYAGALIGTGAALAAVIIVFGFIL